MDIYWQHISGDLCSEKFENPEALTKFSDRYFEDYCICSKNPIMNLKTVGLRSCEPDYRLINKYADRHVIHWIISGEGWYNGLPFSAGDVIYFKSSIPYSFSSNPSNPCTYAWITFDGDGMRKYMEYAGFIKKTHIFRCEHSKEVLSILYSILYENHENVDLHLYFEAFMYRLISLSIPQKAKESEFVGNAIDNKIKLALKYISSHYYKQSFRVTKVSEAVGISEKYLRLQFKKQTGTSIRDYVTKLRIDAAAELMKNSNYNIGEIAELVGYTDYRQFSEMFKSKMGISPRNYLATFKNSKTAN